MFGCHIIAMPTYALIGRLSALFFFFASTNWTQERLHNSNFLTQRLFAAGVKKNADDPLYKSAAGEGATWSMPDIPLQCFCLWHLEEFQGTARDWKHMPMLYIRRYSKVWKKKKITSELQPIFWIPSHILVRTVTTLIADIWDVVFGVVERTKSSHSGWTSSLFQAFLTPHSQFSSFWSSYCGNMTWKKRGALLLLLLLLGVRWTNKWWVLSSAQIFPTRATKWTTKARLTMPLVQDLQTCCLDLQSLRLAHTGPDETRPPNSPQRGRTLATLFLVQSLRWKNNNNQDKKKSNYKRNRRFFHTNRPNNSQTDPNTVIEK